MAPFQERSVHFPLEPQGETSPVDWNLVMTEARRGRWGKGCHIQPPLLSEIYGSQLSSGNSTGMLRQFLS